MPATAEIVAIMADPKGRGYWEVAKDGAVFTFGPGLNYHGGMNGKTISAPIVDAQPTRTGEGYWLLGGDGAIYAFGDAKFHGRVGG